VLILPLLIKNGKSERNIKMVMRLSAKQVQLSWAGFILGDFVIACGLIASGELLSFKMLALTYNGIGAKHLHSTN
jgi:hypothetical protein